ncbi:QsdR family transcriptional regulator [Agromyces sp. SYSU T00194]|uniref:QsdR family transcriptional regulator n=1 Tax=Agromyces chitinivorans TaxID=3158560 RepID=UPI0033909FB1
MTTTDATGTRPAEPAADEASAPRLGLVAVRAVPTRLSDRLGMSGEPHADALRAFRAARHEFIAGSRIDMGALAADLGVDRTSLFRWVGNRDALLSEVLWSLAIPTLDRADHPELHGPARLVELLSAFVDALIDADYFRTFLTREPARALRLLTTADSEIQRRLRVVIETAIDEEAVRGTYTPPLPTADLAYLLARIAESFIYADLITGDEPDAAKARDAFALVLGR